MKDIDSEQTFREIMSKSKLDVPFPDFDDKVMGLIEKKLLKKVAISRDIKLSWVFFILGSAFGILVPILLSQVQQPVLGMDIDNLRIPFLIIFSFLILSQIDSLIDFYKRQKNITKR
jgi:hypothetical protein